MYVSSSTQTLTDLSVISHTRTPPREFWPHEDLVFADCVNFVRLFYRTTRACVSYKRLGLFWCLPPASTKTFEDRVFSRWRQENSAWEGFANAIDLNKIQSFINKSKRVGYCSPYLPDFENLCTSMNGDLFNKVLKISTHVLHPLLPVSYTHLTLPTNREV